MKKTFKDIQVGDHLYRMVICGIPHIRKETVTKVYHGKAVSYIITDESPEVIVNSSLSYQKWMYNAVATNHEDMLPDAIAETERIMEVKNKEIKYAKEIIKRCKYELKNFKKYEQAKEQ